MVIRKNNFQWARYILVVSLIFMVSGCAAKDQEKKGLSVPVIEPGRIVYLGLKPALSLDQEATLFNNPVTGAEIRSEPVGQSTADILSDRLYTILVDSKDYEFVNLHEIKNLTDPALYEEGSRGGIEIIQAIGKAVSADIAMTGYIYRMHERGGSEYSIDSPASVAFDVYLIRVEDGSFLWKGIFDKTQKPLSDNILELNSFLKFKGKWVDAQTLAEVGLNELVDDMPLKST
jgi:hypothetical protein